MTVEQYDNINVSVAVILAMWDAKARLGKFTLPKIPDDLLTHELSDFLNRWLFKTKLLDSDEYRKRYNAMPYVNGLAWRESLEQIFCE